MAEFSAGAVMTMLGLVETTIIGLYLHLAGRKADEADVDDVEGDVEDVEETAEAALAQTRRLEREVAAVDRRLDDAATDGGPDADA